jgi:hypothetical protein
MQPHFYVRVSNRPELGPDAFYLAPDDYTVLHTLPKDWKRAWVWSGEFWEPDKESGIDVATPMFWWLRVRDVGCVRLTTEIPAPPGYQIVSALGEVLRDADCAAQLINSRVTPPSDLMQALEHTSLRQRFLHVKEKATATGDAANSWSFEEGEGWNGDDAPEYVVNYTLTRQAPGVYVLQWVKRHCEADMICDQDWKRVTPSEAADLLLTHGLPLHPELLACLQPPAVVRPDAEVGVSIQSVRPGSKSERPAPPSPSDLMQTLEAFDEDRSTAPPVVAVQPARPGDGTAPSLSAKDFAEATRQVRRLLEYMLERPEAELSEVCKAVWKKSRHRVTNNMIRSALKRANRFLDTLPAATWRIGRRDEILRHK